MTRKKQLTLSFLIVFSIVCISCNRTTVKNNSLAITLSGKGAIEAIDFGQAGNLPIVALTSIAGCKQVSETRRINKDGYIQFERYWKDANRNRCKVTDRFITLPESIQWEVLIEGDGDPWTAPIETVLNYPTTDRSSFWTTWSAMEKSNGEWRDPLQSKPFEEQCLNYGGGDILDPNSLVIPMFSILEKESNSGFSLVQAVTDTILDMQLLTSASGNITLSRKHHKISSDSPIRLRMHLLAHVADWRAGLDFCTRTYPQYFEPVSLNVHEVAGCGAYSSWEGELDTAKLNQMAFKFNWKSTFDFPYMGLFLPEVKDKNERWERFHQGGIKVGDGFTSVNEMEGYMARMKSLGYHVLCYFNLTEAGNHILYPPPARKAKEDKDLWRDPNDFVYYSEINKALLKRTDATDDSPVYSNWEGCIVVDPGEEVYKNHLLTQAKRHIDYLPSNSGLCIDRLDWLREYNSKGDDKVSWKGNQSSRSLLFSWKDIMNELGPMIHSSGKVIFANVLTSRIDILNHIDAVYDEYGQIPLSLNRSAFMTLKKPLIAWTASVNDFTPDPDHYIQRHLYLGSFLTVPFPGNDHTIRPDREIEQYYMDYGEMLAALKGKQWVLTPEALRVEQGNAKANIFENNSSYMIPIVFGKDETAEISVKGLETSYSSCRILYPGGKRQTSAVNKGDRVYFDIPLVRGCGMLIINK